eukprot:scaffold42179_cov19-Tisochrysis_lutea.AAC.2
MNGKLGRHAHLLLALLGLTCVHPFQRQVQEHVLSHYSDAARCGRTLSTSNRLLWQLWLMFPKRQGKRMFPAVVEERLMVHAHTSLYKTLGKSELSAIMEKQLMVHVYAFVHPTQGKSVFSAVVEKWLMVHAYAFVCHTQGKSVFSAVVEKRLMVHAYTGQIIQVWKQRTSGQTKVLCLAQYALLFYGEGAEGTGQSLGAVRHFFKVGEQRAQGKAMVLCLAQQLADALPQMAAKLEPVVKEHGSASSLSMLQAFKRQVPIHPYAEFFLKGKKFTSALSVLRTFKRQLLKSLYS